MGETVDQAGRDRITAEDVGHRDGQPEIGNQSDGRALGQNDIDLKPHQLGGECRNTREIVVAETILDGKVTALYIA
jgi:hypothetical protein